MAISADDITCDECGKTIFHNTEYRAYDGGITVCLDCDGKDDAEKHAADCDKQAFCDPPEGR